MQIENLVISDINFWEEHELNKGGIRISWSANIGFGVLDIVKTKDNKLIAHTECMSNNKDKNFVKEILNILLDNIEIVE